MDVRIMSKWEEGKPGRPPLQTRPHELLDEKEQKLELSDLYRANGKWTPEQKIQAATAMMITGTSKKAQDLTGIPAATIRWWATQASWWPELMKAVRKEKDEELDAMQTSLIHKAGEEIMDRLENGDEHVTKDGDIVNKKVSGRDAAIIHGTLFDKRALNRGNPTSRTEKTDSEALDQLAVQMEQFTRRMEEAGHFAKPIQGEVIKK
jgi:hypothetical protein